VTTVRLPDALAPLLARIDAVAVERGLRPLAVGGSVRDALRGATMRDLDIAVDGDALAFARSLADALDGHFVELDDVHAIARVALDSGGVRYIDVAALQGTIDDDLRRRDFTIDAMAAPLAGGDIIDPAGGAADLAAGVVRMTSPGVLDEDPLRLLRGVRIASELRFTIEPATLAAIRERAPRVNEAAAERRRDELARILALDDAYGALRLLDDAALLDALLPDVARGRGVAQPEQFHAYDVLEHNLQAVRVADLLLAEAPRGPDAWLAGAAWEAFGDRAAWLRAYFDEEMSEGRTRGAMLKLAALLHDVAKPQTKARQADGRIRFFGHADEGATVAARVLRGLRCSAREVAFVSLLVREHLRPVQLAAVGQAPTRRALYRFCRDLGDAMPAALVLALVDAAAARGPSMTREGWMRQAGYMNSVLVRSQEEEGIVRAPRLLDGRDIMAALGLAEGPEVGRLLESLREAQATGEVTDRAQALAWVRRRASGGERQ